MANPGIIADGPITMMDAEGREIVIPLTALTIVGGTVNTDGWPAFKKYSSDDQKIIQGWLAQLVSDGTVSAPAAAQPVPAMTVRASAPGPAGNLLSVKVDSGTSDPDPSKTTFNVSVVLTQTYTGLTRDTVESVLGSDANPLPQPGLVDVVHGSIDPTKQVDAHKTATFPAPPAATKSRADLLDATNNRVVTLEANRTFGTTTLALSNFEDVNNTFTIVAKWLKPVVESQTITGVQISTIATKLGTDTVPLVSPGIVEVVHGTVDATKPIDQTKTAYTFDIPSGAAKPQVKIAGTGGTAAILEANRLVGHATLTLSNFAGLASDPTFDMTVTQSGGIETQQFDGVSLANIEAKLGSDTVPAELPTLIEVVHGSVKSGGIVDKAKAAPVFPASPNVQSAQVDVTNGSNVKVFTLEANELTGTIAIDVAPAVSPPGAFQLTVTRTFSAPGVTVLTVQSGASALASLATIAPPPGAAFSVPSAGTTQLTGGSDAPPSPASATVFASST
jgi:hypothetical protein